MLTYSSPNNVFGACTLVSVKTLTATAEPHTGIYSRLHTPEAHAYDWTNAFLYLP